MDFTLSSEQEMLKSLAERFAADRDGAGSPAAHRQEHAGYATQNWQLLADMGLLGLPFAESLGGVGGGDVEIMAACEAFGRGLVGEPVLNEIIIAGKLLEHAGTPAQQEHWIPRQIAGEAHLALAYAEHGTRYRLDHCATTASNGRITGVKHLVQAGADAWIVTAAVAPHFAPSGPILWLVPAAAPGVTSRRYSLIDGSAAAEITFAGAPAEPLAGGMDALIAVTQTARIAACAEMIGLMSLLFDTTIDYVRQRRQFGVAIGSFQAIQHRLADLYATLELARSLLYRCVLASPDARGAAIAGAKSYISTAAIKLGEECIQFHGGMGVSDELAIGHAHKRNLLLAHLFGDADYELHRYNAALAA